MRLFSLLVILSACEAEVGGPPVHVEANGPVDDAETPPAPYEWAPMEQEPDPGTFCPGFFVHTYGDFGPYYLDGRPARLPNRYVETLHEDPEGPAPESLRPCTILVRPHPDMSVHGITWRSLDELGSPSSTEVRARQYTTSVDTVLDHVVREHYYQQFIETPQVSGYTPAW